MFFSTKKLTLLSFFVFAIIKLNAQYQTSDFVPSGILSNEIHAPGRMAVDVNGILYITDTYKKKHY